MIDPGRLIHPVTFARFPAGDDGYGNTIPAGAAGNPVDFLLVWGELMEARGREAVDAGRVAEIAPAVLIVWDSPDVRGVTPGDVVKHDGRAWNIRTGPIPLLRDPGMVEFGLERGVAL